MAAACALDSATCMHVEHDGHHDLQVWTGGPPNTPPHPVMLPSGRYLCTNASMHKAWKARLL